MIVFVSFSVKLVVGHREPIISVVQYNFFNCQYLMRVVEDWEIQTGGRTRGWKAFS